MSTRKGFSLAELMIVVAIIGILAAIAVPNFARMQLKSKRAEIPGNMNGIKTAQVAYHAAHNQYIEGNTEPRSFPGKDLVVWDADALTDANWNYLGWRPDGPVRGTYLTAPDGDEDFVVEGHSDADGDFVPADFTASANVNPTMDSGDETVY